MLQSKMYNLLSARYLVNAVGQRSKVSSQVGKGYVKALNMTENSREL